ncbi:hypothetical protein ILUMI_07283, partial [Ignelater luminosus]
WTDPEEPLGKYHVSVLQPYNGEETSPVREIYKRSQPRNTRNSSRGCLHFTKLHKELHTSG